MQTKIEQAPLYANPTQRLFGEGSFSGLSQLLDQLKPASILVVLGERSFRSSAYYVQLNEMLEGYKSEEAAAVSQNPAQAFIQSELDRLTGRKFDLIIAIGGGSVLDVSKLYAAILPHEEHDLQKFIDKTALFSDRRIPLIAVPTTSGTGSEVTPYSSIETDDKQKISLSGPFLYPAFAIIDPELTYSMPDYVTASTGFDALSQAIESFWAVQATPFSQTHALRALELIMRYLEQAKNEPLNAEARRALSLASCEAGLAIAHTKTTAVHSVSYPITAHFGIAHGHACALTLAGFVRFNESVLQKQAELLLRPANAASFEELAQKIEKLMTGLGLERSLGKLGIGKEGIQLIIRDGFRPDRIRNNPRNVSAPELETILNSIA